MKYVFETLWEKLITTSKQIADAFSFKNSKKVSPNNSSILKSKKSDSAEASQQPQKQKSFIQRKHKILKKRCKKINFINCSSFISKDGQNSTDKEKRLQRLRAREKTQKKIQEVDDMLLKQASPHPQVQFIQNEQFFDENGLQISGIIKEQEIEKCYQSQEEKSVKEMINQMGTKGEEAAGDNKKILDELDKQFENCSKKKKLRVCYQDQNNVCRFAELEKSIEEESQCDYNVNLENGKIIVKKHRKSIKSMEEKREKRQRKPKVNRKSLEVKRRQKFQNQSMDNFLAHLQDNEYDPSSDQ